MRDILIGLVLVGLSHWLRVRTPPEDPEDRTPVWETDEWKLAASGYITEPPGKQGRTP